MVVGVGTLSQPLELCFVNPLNALTVRPPSIFLLTLRIYVNSNTLLLAVHPLPDVCATVRPSKRPEALLFVLEVLAFIPSRVRPRK